jgi:hypothetical protein
MTPEQEATVFPTPEEESRFTEMVQQGFASLNPGEYIEHYEIAAGLQRLLQP